ncbi:MAG: histidine phosphotransferase family protein [Alphaproteobacteria bacterium]
MSENAEYRLMELLASRLCHDLAAPVGAVDNGLELIADGSGADSAEVAELLRSSARRAVGIVRFHRMAWGQAGHAGLSSLADLRDACDGWLHDLPFVLNWPTAASAPALLPGQGRAILNGVALARQMLPRGGTIRVALAVGDGGLDASIEAAGPGARIEPAVMAACEPAVDPETLTPATVQAHWTALCTRRSRGTVSLVQVGPERVIVRMRLPMRGA